MNSTGKQIFMFLGVKKNQVPLVLLAALSFVTTIILVVLVILKYGMSPQVPAVTVISIGLAFAIFIFCVQRLVTSQQSLGNKHQLENKTKEAAEKTLEVLHFLIKTLDKASFERRKCYSLLKREGGK